MRKFINEPTQVVDDMLAGLLAARPDVIRSVRSDNKAIARAARSARPKVGIITGGGSGHLPLFVGYVGEGLLDGCAVGDIFQSPSAEQILDATRASHYGMGVLYLYGNYGGDVMNFDIAAELAAAESIETRAVVGADDVASMPPEQSLERRGVAGIFFQFKCAAALAERGASLDEVAAVAKKAGAATRTMGVALSPCIIPAIGKPGFEIPEGEMEIGMGIHGEPGIERGPLKSAREVAESMFARINTELALRSSDNTAVLINGLGATPLEELYIVFAEIERLIKATGARVHKTYVGEYATSMEMTGLSISVARLDHELESLIDEPFSTMFHVQGAR